MRVRLQARAMHCAISAWKHSNKDSLGIHAIKNINSGVPDRAGHTYDDGIRNEPPALDPPSTVVQHQLGLINWKRSPKTKGNVTINTTIN